jgi:hypothetical protein
MGSVYFEWIGLTLGDVGLHIAVVGDQREGELSYAFFA